MKRLFASAIVFGICVAACSSSDDSKSTASTALTLVPPAANPGGKSYSDWNTAWWKWLYESPLDASCKLPLGDATGELCAVNQSGDVWFLVGNNGGNMLRTKCVVPAGKSLFFPILNTSSDNGGVEPDKRLDDATMQKIASDGLNGSTDIVLELDGVKIDSSLLRVEPTRFSYTLPPEPNTYSCLGATGVTGLVDPCYAGGYYAFVGPVSAGQHTVHFSGRNGTFALDVTYQLTVQ